MRQNVGLDGGDGDGTRNNTSRRFQKRAGGKKGKIQFSFRSRTDKSMWKLNSITWPGKIIH